MPLDEERAKLRQEAGPRATTPNGAPFPLRSWPPDAAIDIQGLAEWADPMKPETLRRFANAAARDAAIPAPTEGMSCYLIDLRQIQTRIGTSWRPTGGTLPHGTGGLPWGTQASGDFKLAIDSLAVTGGMTFDSAARCLVAPVLGRYRITTKTTFMNVGAGVTARIGIGSDTSYWHWGTIAAPVGNAVSSMDMFYVDMNPGQKVTAWKSSTASVHVEYGELYVDYIGP